MPEILNIITHPNPILRKKSLPVNLADVSLGKYANFLENMKLTMVKKDGVGLAAPQISENLRIIVVQIQDKIVTFINPLITKKSWSKEIGEEGCLSVPNVFKNVKRHKRIGLAYYDEKGKKQKMIAEGMLSRILQHEIDHLDGILFIDKIEDTPKS
jgi:peptide deformylase